MIIRGYKDYYSGKHHQIIGYNIKNLSGKTTNWEIIMEMPEGVKVNVDSGAVVSQIGNKVTVIGANYNSTLNINASTTFNLHYESVNEHLLPLSTIINFN